MLQSGCYFLRVQASGFLRPPWLEGKILLYKDCGRGPQSSLTQNSMSMLIMALLSILLTAAPWLLSAASASPYKCHVYNIACMMDALCPSHLSACGTHLPTPKAACLAPPPSKRHDNRENKGISRIGFCRPLLSAPFHASAAVLRAAAAFSPAARRVDKRGAFLTRSPTGPCRLQPCNLRLAAFDGCLLRSYLLLDRQDFLRCSYGWMGSLPRPMGTVRDH